MDHYAMHRAEAIAAWSQSPPGWVARGFGRALAPASRAAQTLVPLPVLQSILRGSQGVARWQFHHRLPQPEPGQNLRDCDGRARRVAKVAAGLAGGLGAVTGVGGAWGMAADIPLLLTLALGSIERTVGCYGLDVDDPPALAMGIFALASANTVQEKQHALRSLDVDPETLTVAAVRDGLERALQRQMAKDAVQLSLTQVARQLGGYLGQRKLAQSLPLVGAVAGSTVNAMYIHDVCTAAQHICALRYLLHSPVDGRDGDRLERGSARHDITSPAS